MSAKQWTPTISDNSYKFPHRLLVSCCLLLLLLQLSGQSSGLQLTSMNTPIVADIREAMELECHYDMGNEELYAVKWYKDDNEFFRYMPAPRPNTMLFPVSGVHLEPRGTNCSLGYCKVKLQKLSKDHSAGAYRCEISGEGPEFRLAAETHNVTVAALPRENPRIEGLTASYLEGDTIEARCISDRADPVPILSWYVNGERAPSNAVGEQISSEPDTIGLISRTITLRLPVERKLSREDSIEIRCKSTIPGVHLPPQITTHVVPVKSPDDAHLNNQKLHWYSVYNVACRRVDSWDIARFLLSMLLLQFSIGGIFN